MKIHREGYVIITVTTLLVLVLSLGYQLLTDFPCWVNCLLGTIVFIVWVLVVRFFREPHRPVVLKEGTVLCPCDGKIVTIETVYEPEYLKTECKQVSVFMSPLNVHINWYPISGKVVYSKYHKGKYLVAFHPKSSTENERTTVVVQQKETKVLFRQIAGAVARRIVCYAKENDVATQGGEYGFIKFGSRIDLYLPLDADIKVSIGDVVVGNTTLIAELR